MSSAPVTTTDADKPRLAELAPGLIIVAVMLGVMWAEELIDLLPGTPFHDWGIRPRSIRGLFGIAFAPFLHTGFPHLIGNTIPFVILGGAIALSGNRVFLEVTIFVALTSGLGVWIFGAGNTIHFGASGLVFGYLTYLVSRGVIAKNAWWIVGGLVTLAFYGGLFWGLLPSPRVSWLGHVFGAVGGVLAAWIIHGDHDLDDDPATASGRAP